MTEAARTTKIELSDSDYEITVLPNDSKQEDGTLTISNEYADGIIPEDAYANNQKITKLVITNNSNIKEIGNHAFKNCKNLTQIKSDSVTTIKSGAFAESGLSQIQDKDLPNVTNIEPFAFYKCDQLTRVCFPQLQTIKENVFTRCGLSQIEQKDLPNVRKIKEEAFENCENLTEVHLPELKTIGEDAFSGCKELSCINMPKVNEIKDDAFDGCKSLSEIHTGSEKQCKLFYNELDKSGPLDDKDMAEQLENGSIKFFYVDEKGEQEADLKKIATTPIEYL